MKTIDTMPVSRIINLDVYMDENTPWEVACIYKYDPTMAEAMDILKGNLKDKLVKKLYDIFQNYHNMLG